jgi:hypothetical protein
MAIIKLKKISHLQRRARCQSERLIAYFETFVGTEYLSDQSSAATSRSKYPDIFFLSLSMPVKSVPDRNLRKVSKFQNQRFLQKGHASPLRRQKADDEFGSRCYRLNVILLQKMQRPAALNALVALFGGR